MIQRLVNRSNLIINFLITVVLLINISACSKQTRSPKSTPFVPRTLKAIPKFEQYYSKRLNHWIYSTKYIPSNSEYEVLPFMGDHSNLFKDKTVLDIGTGSGILALYACKLGAKKVIATDIDPLAIKVVAENKRILGCEKVIEERLVPTSDPSAYSVIKPDEQFDTIISHPFFILTEEELLNPSLRLGMSIIRGLPKHLKAKGVAALYYRDLLFHEYFEEYAKYHRFETKSFHTSVAFIKNYSILVNFYFQAIFEKMGRDKNWFKFKPPTDVLRFCVSKKNDCKEGCGISKYAGILLIKLMPEHIKSDSP